MELHDLSEEDLSMIHAVASCTMTSVERRASLLSAIDYVVANEVDGDFVECGVWRGGSSMLAALGFKSRGDTTRTLWLYDTFDGMSEPTEDDRDYAGVSAARQLATGAKTDDIWAIASLDDVRANLATTGYPPERIRCIVGEIEHTIPADAPEQIAILRLDTDWYESTRHELEHLYPRLVPGGILIIDDYGHWMGARKAVDEYFAGQRLYLHRVDYTGRLLVKPFA